MIIDKTPLGRRFVISDIHGCYRTFRQMIHENIKLKPEDQLFLLGDFINRGPHAAMLLDDIIDLLNKKYKIFCLRGNHEENLLNARYQYDKEALKTYLESYNSTDLIDDNGDLQADYRRFLEGMKFYYELDHFYLVHAGFNFEAEQPFEDFNAMLEIRDFEVDPSFVGDKFIIHGHQPVELDVIKNAINQRHQNIPLDNGCVLGLNKEENDFSKKGNLCCLNLDTFELMIQPNIDT